MPPQDFAMHKIMAHAHGKDAEQALARRKLGALGNDRVSSGFANDEKRMKSLKSQLDIAVSLAEIAKATAAAETAKKTEHTAMIIQLAPQALMKLKQNQGVAMKLTKREMCAVAMSAYGGVILKESMSKPALAAELAKLISAQPSVLAGIQVLVVSMSTTQRKPRQKNG
ncbi:MAG: hypothetical protein SGPRY_004638 [Prymnesium sp.]